MTGVDPDRPRWPHVAFALFVAFVVLSLTWPGAGMLGAAEPRVLGLPFSLVWIVGCVVSMFVALLLYDRCAHRGEDR